MPPGAFSPYAEGYKAGKSGKPISDCPSYANLCGTSLNVEKLRDDWRRGWTNAHATSPAWIKQARNY